MLGVAPEERRLSAVVIARAEETFHHSWRIRPYRSLLKTLGFHHSEATMRNRLVPDGGRERGRCRGRETTATGGRGATGCGRALGPWTRITACAAGGPRRPRLCGCSLTPRPEKLSLSPRCSRQRASSCPGGCSPRWSWGGARGASLEGAWFQSQDCQSACALVCGGLRASGLALGEGRASLVQVR